MRTALLLIALLIAVPAVMSGQSATAVFSVPGWTSPEGLPLTYQWACTPACAQIQNGTTDTATVTIDMPGDYSLTVTISDGVVDVVRSKPVTARLHQGPTGPDIMGPDEVVIPPQAAIVSGEAVILTASCTDNIGCIRVDYKIDDAPLGSSLTPPDWVFSMDSTGLTDGLHYVGAVACDEAGNCRNAQPVVLDVANLP